MDVLWAGREPMTVRAVQGALQERELAYTTVMTVLSRLAGKGIVRRERSGRAWLYSPVAGRADYVAELMLDALALSGDSAPALVRFARSVSEQDAATLREALEHQDDE